MSTLLKRIARYLITIEIAYLAIFNTVLNIPFTQSLINQIKPDKFAVSWERAWTFYPFRIHATGVSSNGQITSQQWQVASPSVSASISILPLVFKRVNLSGLKAKDVAYHQRPRPRAGKDYSKISEFFPPIDGRELETTPPPVVGKKQAKAWKIYIDDMQAAGKHTLWLYQLKVSLEGQLSTDMRVQTRSGPISLQNGLTDIRLDSITLNGHREVSREGHIKGSFEMLPFVAKENKGIKALNFLKLDAKISTYTRSLAFLNVYLNAFQGMSLSGTGEVTGRLVLDQGRLQANSDLKIIADALRLNILEYRIEGEGDVNIRVPSDADKTNFEIKFDGLSAFFADETRPLLEGNGLVVSGVGSTSFLPTAEEHIIAKSLALLIDSVHVPNLQSYQRFLPDKWKTQFLGGEGKLEGQFQADHGSMSSRIKLISEDATIGIKNYQFHTNLDMQVQLNSPDLESGKFEVSDTYFKLFDSKISGDVDQTKAWKTSIKIDEGTIDLNLADSSSTRSGAKFLAKTLRESSIQNLLENSDETLKISGYISDLRWLNLLIKNPYDFAISGGGAINSIIMMIDGQLTEATMLTVDPDAIAVDVLDYRAEGNGSIELKVVKGGASPDLSMNVEIEDGQFKRTGEKQAFIEDVHIILDAIARGVQTDKNMSKELVQQDVDLRLRIPSAQVLDMRVYNQYLPEGAPLNITGGQASLTADIQLQPDDAKGFVHLATEGLQSRVDEQQVSARLDAQINLIGGTPKDMVFDIGGSAITLDEVRVIGEEKNFRDDEWAVQFLLTRGETMWRKPIQLDLEAELEMTDSIPIISMMANKKGKETWLGKALTIDDVKGTVQMKMANEQIVIPYAYAGSDNIDVGAKAVISKASRDGILYARWHKLHGILKIRDGNRNIDVIGAQKKFEEYSTEQVILKQSQTE